MASPIDPVWSDERGNSLIEMALVLPILMVLMFGIVDISTSYARKLELEQAASAGTEMVTAAGLDAPGIDDRALAADVAAAARVAANNVTVTRWRQCRSGPLDPALTACPDGSTASLYWRIVVQDVFSPPFGFSLLGRSGQSATLRGSAVVRGG